MKKRNGGKNIGGRKALTVRLSPENYLELCEFAGSRSLSDAVGVLIQSISMRSPRENAPLPRK